MRQRGRELLRDLERGFLLLEPSGPDGAGLRPTVPRIDHDRQRLRGSRHRGRGRLEWGRGGRLASHFHDEAIGRGQRVGARRQFRIAKLDRRGVPGKTDRRDERVVVLLFGKRRVDARFGEAHLEALFRQRGRRFRRRRQPQDDLRGGRNVHHGDLERQGRNGRNQRPHAA